MIITKTMLAKLSGLSYRTILRRLGAGKVDIRGYFSKYCMTEEDRYDLALKIIDILNKPQK